MISSCLPHCHRLLLCLCGPISPQKPSALGLQGIFSRARSQLAPRQVKHVKRHKGRIPIPIGGSIKGTTLAYGDWGIRIKGNGARISAKQLTTAEEAIKRKIKVVKGSRVYLRVFPDIPVCIKVILDGYLTHFPDIYLQRVMKLGWVKERERLSSGLPGRISLKGICFRTFLSSFCSVPMGRVIFEIGGTPIREELAREGNQ